MGYIGSSRSAAHLVRILRQCQSANKGVTKGSSCLRLSCSEHSVIQCYTCHCSPSSDRRTFVNIEPRFTLNKIPSPGVTTSTVEAQSNYWRRGTQQLRFPVPSVSGSIGFPMSSLSANLLSALKVQRGCSTASVRNQELEHKRIQNPTNS